jgi:hypothetical protein
MRSVKSKNVYKKHRSFFKAHKLECIMCSILATIFIAILCVLIFYAKIFQQFGSTSIIKSESHGTQSGTMHYEVDGIEYEISYNFFGLDNDKTYSESDTVYYLISDPGYYVLNRNTYIIVFSIAEAVIVAMICAPIINGILKAKKRSK